MREVRRILPPLATAPSYLGSIGIVQVDLIPDDVMVMNGEGGPGLKHVAF